MRTGDGSPAEHRQFVRALTKRREYLDRILADWDPDRSGQPRSVLRQQRDALVWAIRWLDVVVDVEAAAIAESRRRFEESRRG